MRAASDALKSLLASGQPFCMADCYSFDLVGGASYRWASADADVAIDGISYSSRGPVISGGRVHLVRGLEVDTCDITISAGPDITHNGLPLMQALAWGFFDRAAITLRRAFMASWASPVVGSIIVFSGRVSDISPGAISAKITVKSAADIFNVKIPHRIIQPSCSHVFGDVNCGVNRSAYEKSGTVSSSSATSVTVALPSVQPDGYWVGGVLSVSTGQMAGLSRLVSGSVGSTLFLSSRFPATLAAGDHITVSPGCDKLLMATDQRITTATITNSFSVDIGDASSVDMVLRQPYLRVSHTMIAVDGNPSADQYSVSSGIVTFSSADIGASVTISYTDYINEELTLVETTVEIPSGRTISVPENIIMSITMAARMAPAASLSPVSSAPGEGQYCHSGRSLIFSSADMGRTVSITASYIIDNTSAVCKTRYKNQARYCGFPFVPVPETSL